MFKLSKKVLATVGTLAVTSLFLLPALVGAQTADPATGNYGLGDAGFQKLGIGQTRDIKDTIAQIINIILGFLGVIAVVIVLAGGFKWMTAGGNEDKVGEARKMIIQGVIGLVIIFAAWGIASFVITQLRTATTGV